MIAFEIPYPRDKAAWNKRFGLNAYYAGKHWSLRKKDAKDLHALTQVCMRKANVPREIVKGPVELRFFFNDHLDCSNHAVIVKGVEDAMKGWVIQDDSRKFVRRITVEFHDENCIRVEVRKIEQGKYEEEEQWIKRNCKKSLISI